MQLLVLSAIKRLYTQLCNRIESGGSYYYQGLKGEALPAEASTYVCRSADDELYEFVRSSDRRQRACYILAARQMGKSSLMARAARRLAGQGAICIQLSLQTSGGAVAEQALYFSILRAICQRFTVAGKSLVPELEAFWQEAPEMSPALRFQSFVTSILRQIGGRRIIVFIDDVGDLIAWKLQDSLTGTLRALSESEEESLRRLSFVLLGVAKPGELFASAGSALDAAVPVELEPLKGDCQPLLAGLSQVSANAGEVLQEILFWTGGQPFLTQFLCDLVVKRLRIQGGAGVKEQVEQLVRSEIIQDWRQRQRLSPHFQGIENWFLKAEEDGPEKGRQKLYALNLYARILEGDRIVKLNEGSQKQLDLLLSGLAVKSGQVLQVANPIYRQIFSSRWVEETKKTVKQRTENMPIPQVFNRDVFILIDRSASMTIPDSATGNKTRWEYLQETVRGHVYDLLSEQDDDYGKICDEVTLYFFNVNRPPTKTIYLRDAAQVPSAFKENKPGGSTYIAPSLNEAISQWFANRKDDRGAFVIIYTDGQIDDRKEFVSAIQATCKNINSQDEIKILMIGIGSDIQLENTVEFYLDLDFNATKFKSRRGEDCNIFIFDLIDDVMDEGIIAALERQLEGDPQKGLASWVKERYPKLYSKYFGA